MKKCLVDGCRRPNSARDLCHTHYEKQRRSGTLEYRPTVCRVEDCGKRVIGHGWCQNHYMKMRRTGTLVRERRVAYQGDGYRQDRHMWSRYRMEIAEYDELYALQGGLCAICEEPRPSRGFNRLAIDHSHETGTVRGLLCRQCNSALAQAERAPLFLVRAYDYLKDAEDDANEAVIAALDRPELKGASK